jgi:hypothetical protein
VASLVSEAVSRAADGCQRLWRAVKGYARVLPCVRSRYRRARRPTKGVKQEMNEAVEPECPCARSQSSWRAGREHTNQLQQEIALEAGQRRLLGQGEDWSASVRESGQTSSCTDFAPAYVCYD